MVLLMMAALAADPAPALPALQLEGNHVLIDGQRAPLTRARPYLIADAGSRDQARRAKKTGLVGRIITITGASVIVLGALSASSSDDYGSGVGMAIVGAGMGVSGSIVSLRSNGMWKKAVPLYRQEPYVP
ncbi:MAG: hypothetical protein R3F61_13825 [Myxococcota bacterium]